MIHVNDIYTVALIWESDNPFVLDLMTVHILNAFNELPANIRYTSDNRKAFLFYCFTEYKQSQQVISLSEFNERANSIHDRIQIIFENNLNAVKIDGRYPLNPEFAVEFNKPEYQQNEINQ